MPDFQFIAREATGLQVTGTLSAASRHEALGALAARQLFPVRVDVAETGTAASRMGFTRRIRAQHLVTFYSQLADLLRSGVPLLRSLELLEKQSNAPALCEVVQDVREQVADGSRLADAMRRHPRAFGELAISMIRAGEEGSFVEDVLKRIALFTEHQQELKGRVVGAMIYPAFLLVAMIGVVTAMLVFFVPKFEPIFQRLSEQGTLPWATTALMTFSDLAQRYWLPAIGLLVAAGWGTAKWLKTDDGRLTFDRLRLRAFGVGPVVKSLAIARFCRILGTLLKNGVPILASLRIARDATGNRVLGDAIGDAAENVSEGKSLAEPLRGCGWFPPEIVEMIAVGEEANNLEQVLIDVADGMERRTNRLLDVAVRMLEPILLTIMAGMVLFVVLALLWPIMQSSNLM